MPSTVVVVAHPDDEVVGAGSRLPRLREATLVHVTDGAPRDPRDARAAGFATREAYARARRDELLAVLQLAGIERGHARALGCVDQEATLNLAALARRLVTVLLELRPKMVLTHAYEGGHPDHDATAFAVQAAVRLLQREGGRAPAIVEMAGYHGLRGHMVVQEFLPEGGPPDTVVLSPAERCFKQRLLECYRTQRDTLRWFSVEHERFRLAPQHDFTRAPHPGRLLYECFAWGMTGPRFRRLAAAAEVELGLRSER